MTQQHSKTEICGILIRTAIRYEVKAKLEPDAWERTQAEAKGEAMREALLLIRAVNSPSTPKLEAL